LDGTLLSWNQGAEKMFGYSAEEALGRRISTLVPPEDRRVVSEVIEQVKQGETVSQMESRFTLRDGRRIDVSLSAFPICNVRGELVSLAGIVRDITERQRARRAQEELKARQAQLEVAQEIQKRLLPQSSPTLPGIDIAGALSPAELAAGDYFDYLPMIDGSLAIAVGDVSGHGFGPALLMAATSAHLRSLVQVSDDIEEILGLLNGALVARTADQHFVTFLLARLDHQSRSLTYASAGHPTGYVLDVSGNLKACLESTGFPLAISPDAEFPMGAPIKLDPGNTIVLLTDGFLESRSPDGKQFRAERVLDVVRANRGRTAQGIIECLYLAVQEFSGQKTLDDDLTAVVIKLAP
jgi:sigma-B regulation protein RsbU (phosphoserine phosphatase)